MSRRRRRREWSELQGELLEAILEKLDLVNHARFASVCSSWRSIAVENPPISKPLYLALSDDPENLVRRFITSFIPSWKKVMFIGALDGWLVVIIDGLKLFLLNKGFNSIIPLPPLLLEPEGILCKAVLSSPPSSSSSVELECTVFIKHFVNGVFYCRLGADKSFRNLDESLRFIQDILFYKRQLYVLSCDDTIVIFDHLLNKESRLVTHHLANIPSPRFLSKKLLISGNKLLIVVTLREQYSMFTLEGSNPMVARLSNIDDNSLLIVNPYCSLSITSNKHKGFRRYKYSKYRMCTYILDNGKEPYDYEGEPWPLFFFMFKHVGIKND